MKHDSRDAMIQGALTLLAQKGLQATSFSEVLKLTGAPRGSIYHHFPGGKDELVSEALQLLEKRTADEIRALDGSSPKRIVEGFCGLWRLLLTTYDFAAGCSALAVTVATESRNLLHRSQSIFETWQSVLTEKLTRAGVASRDAAVFATALVAATEGAVVMARAAKNMEPFERVAAHLTSQARLIARNGGRNGPTRGGASPS
jgi:AcrR family transcriptional regulator